MRIVPIYGVTLVRDGSLKVESKRADCPSVVAEILRAHIGPSDREHFVAVLVNARSEVLGVTTISIGTLTCSLVHPRELFKAAILIGAAAVIAGHNHPSGDCFPSTDDKETTRRIVKAGEILGVPLVDHVIIGTTGYFSFKEKGLL